MVGCQQDRRFCAGASAASRSDNAPSEPGFGKVKGFDVLKAQPIFERYVEFDFTEEDVARFASERASFRADPRLQPDSIVVPAEIDEMDWKQTFDICVSLARYDDRATRDFQQLVYNRLEDKELMARFGIFLLEGKTLEKPLHNSHAVPREGAYFRMLQQTYWLVLHTWLLHSKQHQVQEHEGLWGSAVCALITRGLFEWSWLVVRLWLMQEDVPAMNVQSEMEHFMEYSFGFCAALDEAWKQEAPHGTKRALEMKEEDLEEGQVGLLPCVKHVLRSNVYNGAVPHDHPELTELAVYVVRQRLLLEALPKNVFFLARTSWADFPEVSPQS
eukprot:TRINITY_DN109515_c0_g1_i1.p1 TRINITY_DN109515_c0_g1~~TRINITY_DN109515_c0_g1_i1.p1  ORF type:complete len:370 (-),score=72.34 TRINITY_DN109515_c0_g1_i1:31-1020(-)